MSVEPTGSWRLTPLPVPITGAVPAAAPVAPAAEPALPTESLPPDSIDHDDEFETTVRPYARVGGRTRVPAGLGLSVEALVRNPGPAPTPSEPGLSPEQRRILSMTATSYQSVAELSAHLRLPIGVIRVVLADLLAAGRVQVYGRHSPDRPRVGLDILEGVLDGISTL